MSLLLLAGFASSLPADICRLRLPAIYSNGMILQRGQSNTIHGTATPRVAVQLRMDHQTVATQASINGFWEIKIPASLAGGPHKIDLDAADHVSIENIFFGDVWLCGGQSNMARELSITTHNASDIQNSQNSMIRVFTVSEKKSDVVLSKGEGAWLEAGPNTVQNFSACAYFFARELNQKEHIPIGIVSCCARGLPLNVWFSKKVAGLEKAEGPFVTSSVFNAMVAPLVGYGIKGLIWYQGESDIFKSNHYKKMLPKMLDDLREKWKQPDVPIILVQLPNYAEHDAKPSESLWAEFREVQSEAAKSIHNANVVVTFDSASEMPVSLHPLDKHLVAHRLCERAIAMVDHGRQKTFPENPRYLSAKSEGKSMIVHFDLNGLTLDNKTQPVKGFAICGPDKKFLWAEAEVLPGGSDVKVWSAGVTSPVAIRYAWADNPIADLYTTTGVPVTPFRTDNFKAKPGDYQLKGRFNFLHDMGLPAKIN